MRERDIFIEALERESHAERKTYLASACAADAALRQRVDELLAEHHNQKTFFLDVPPPGVNLTLEQPITEKPGMQIGPYKLLQQIGEGGFGVVFMAEQVEPVRRKVALKVIKPGMDTRQVIARFEAERQALAVMDHPNIARVLQAAATASGRPYFVMELVRGIPITSYCDKNNLPVRERLELFATVCHAIQHAHTKGIIHRDIKPTNVLVTRLDGQPVVKVIDFGIAKAMGQQLTEKTLFTEFAQMIGTPLYMSPEQTELTSVDIDTRSDVYSLGLLLYELLTGATPFEKQRFKAASNDEIRRIIREEDPARPSTRLGILGQAASTVSASRNSDLRELRRQLRGELDWIVMKCLEKDRNRRYETPAALAADVKRFLADETVLACPPSAVYRFGKLARRHKRVLISVSVAAFAALLAVSALAVSTVLVWRANQELQQEAYFQRITVAHRELSTDNLGRALELLEECPEALRDWEWHYLMRFCRVEPLVLRDKAEMNGLAFSPDGRRLASAGGDGAIKIWNSKSGDVIQTLKNAHADSVVSVAFHPDGEHVASVGTDRQVKIWDLTTQQEVFTGRCDVGRKFGTSYTVAFNPADGRQLAAGSDGMVTIWDWNERQPRLIFPGHGQSIPVAFSPDGRRLAAGGAFPEGQKLWDTEAEPGGLPLRIFPAHRHPVSALAFSPNGGRLASASFDRKVNVFDTTTGELLHTFLHTGNVDCVAFSPDGRRLASAGEDKTVRIWDATTGREVLALRGHTGRCGCVAFSPDGRRLASASTDGTIRFWDATPLHGNEGQEIRTFTEHSDDIYTVAISPTDGRIASAGYDALVKVWDARTGQVSAEFPGHTAVVFCVAWQPDGRRIASAGSDGRRHSVKVWDARSRQEVLTIRAEQDRFAVPYFAVAFSPDGRYLVTGKGNGALQIWDSQNGRAVATLGAHRSEIRGVVFSRDGRRLASASSDGDVKLWDVTRLTEKPTALHTLRGRVPGACLNVAFSPDGRRLATGGEENTVKIWDVETGRGLHTLRGHSGEVYTVAFSSEDNGHWLASAGEDSAVKIWNSHAGTLVRNFRGHTGLVSSLAFTPDPEVRLLVSGSRDTTVKVWDMTQLSNSEGQTTEALP